VNSTTHPAKRPIVWTIAGSDSGAGAGIQADLKAFEAFGVHGCTVIASVTAQNSAAVLLVEPVSTTLLDAQLTALAQDLPARVIKTGLLASVDNVRGVCRWIDALRAQGHNIALVVDPVLGASSGASFATPELIAAYRNELVPRASLITPNRAEAALLLNCAPLNDDPAVERAAQALHKIGATAVVITGGDYRVTSDQANDYMLTPQAQGWLSVARVETAHHHGTGCVFAATAAAALAADYVLADAVVLAKMATTHALRHGYAAGAGAGPVSPQSDFAQHLENLPRLTTALQGRQSAKFNPLANPALGVYAVVDSAAWVRQVLDAGIRTVQLRIKDPAAPKLESEIVTAIATARATKGAQLFINDHWQLALKHGAYGVHLGQQDLPHADLAALRAAGIRLGVSSHSYWEVARARAINPSYIACGPIFATQTKDMPWLPQGLDNLRYWAALLDVPVVGIAGIKTGNIAEVAAQGVASAAVITAITEAAQPAQACKALLQQFAEGRSNFDSHIKSKRARSTL
jgi:hydroxymethylpyrimidine kinase/phosphomethylpyrimidine kinase/thiamine-phosphate diphosphorylase